MLFSASDTAFCMFSYVRENPLDVAIYLRSHDLRPAFVNTLFPVTRPHHIYSTALVIIIVIDNLKYIINNIEIQNT